MDTKPESSNSDTLSLKGEESSLMRVQTHFKELQDFYGQVLKKDVDYGVIAGVQKPCLFKPGAEKLQLLLNFSITVERTGETLDIDKQFYDCSYKATVTKMNGTKFECEGSCNTFEDKYRYIYETQEGEKPDATTIANLTRQKLGRLKTIDGLLYWQLKVENMSRLAIKNTIQKIAQKRAFVGAVLVASGASTIFTQDLSEDDGQISDELVNKAIDELKAVATKEDLKALVERYEGLYNADTKFTQAAKDLREKLKTTK